MFSADVFSAPAGKDGEGDLGLACRKTISVKGLVRVLKGCTICGGFEGDHSICPSVSTVGPTLREATFRQSREGAAQQ